MRNQTSLHRIKRKQITYLIFILITLASVTPALAAYIGPKRTVIETTSVCKVILYECQYTTAKGWKYHQVDNWSCSNESKPWKAYSSEESPWGCSSTTNGHTYWERTNVVYENTVTYPPATINGTLQNCTPNNGWCTTSPQLSLSGNEPVTGYSITAIEGTRNGQSFACSGSSCNVPLVEGDNNFTYWALSSFADSSTMGSLNAKVDSKQPTITGTLNGTMGLNGWYTSPVTYSGSAGDTTSGLAGFTCTLDGAALGSCGSININGEGPHTLILTARDNAGHTSTLTQNTSIDTQNPILSASLVGTLGSDDWYTAAALNGSASDASPGSGLSAFEYSLDYGSWNAFPSSGVLSLSDGTHTLDIRATDKAGHTVSTTKSFSLDSVAPTITLDPVGSLGTNDWYITDLQLAAAATDNTSGMDVFEYSHDNFTWTSYTAPLVLTNGLHSISFWAQDEAGLVTQVSQTYKVDSQAPQIAGELRGIPGENGWFISDVTLAASVSDPAPGSGMDAFTYTLNGDPEAPYTDELTLSDGQHTIRLDARDSAGLSYSMEETVKVDTVIPSLMVETTLPDWIKDSVTLNGTSNDSGSGLSKVEISLDGGQNWEPVNGDTSWNLTWNTTNSSNGEHEVVIRATDNAGLVTKGSIKTGVDNQAPSISLPDSWYQWDTISLDIRDEYSGLSEARLEISDPENSSPARVISLDPGQFPMQFKWDRRLGDDTVAPAGTYNVLVTATDNLGNSASKTASIKILLDILPPGPTATLQPTPQPSSTPTVPAHTATAMPSAAATQTAVVKTFGSTSVPEPTTTPVPGIPSTPRATPSQTGVEDWLESVFLPHTNTTESAIEIGSLGDAEAGSQTSESGSGVLWGAAAAAMVGAMTSYALDEKRKQEEEEARQNAQKAENEQRRMKARARKMEKLEEKWAQERAWEEARLVEEHEKQLREQALKEQYRDSSYAHLQQFESKEEAKWAAAQAAIEEKKKSEELKAGLEAYYNARKQGETTVATPPKEKSKWEKALDWVDDHQTEIALGIGVAVGIGAIIASGGLATPLVAAAWVAGAATVAAGTVAVGTVALNVHYGRNWNENVLNNIAVAGVAAAAVSGAWFIFQGVSTGIGAYCAVNQATCARVDPIFRALDTLEEVSLNTKLAVQTKLGNEAGARETALEIQMEHMDGGMPGNSIAKEIGGEVLEKVAQYGDEALELVTLYGSDAAQIIFRYGEDGISVLQRYGNNAFDLINDHGLPAVKMLKAVDLEATEKLIETLDDDVLDYAIQQGPDAIAALSRWSAEDLSEHGVELALRAKKDAKVLADINSLIATGSIDPKHLTDGQKALINAIAENSTQYADEGQVVLGKWVDYGNGFVEHAQDTGSVHYNPHPDMWNLLGDLGGQNQADVAWLINQQVVQTGINKGLPFEYTLNGIPVNKIDQEKAAFEAIFSGATNKELMNLLKTNYLPIRMQEIQELQKAGYEFSFDEVTNSFILIP